MLAVQRSAPPLQLVVATTSASISGATPAGRLALLR
jgi:hypothetical protein